MTDFDQDAVLAELDEKAMELRAKLAELTAPVDAETVIGFGKRIGDGTIQAIEQFTNTSTAESLNRTLQEVEAAQSRLADGQYGRCTVCDEPIPAGRLSFRPWAATCVQHAA